MFKMFTEIIWRICRIFIAIVLLCRGIYVSHNGNMWDSLPYVTALMILSSVVEIEKYVKTFSDAARELSIEDGEE